MTLEGRLDAFGEPTYSAEPPHHYSPSAGRSMNSNQNAKVAIASALLRAAKSLLYS